MNQALVEGNPREPVPVPLENAEALGIHRVMDENGEANGDLPDPELPREDLRKIYESMSLLRAIEERGWKLQRSGRIAFWIPMRGQEGYQCGAVHAIDDEDWIFRGHREMAGWIMRGNSLEKLFAQFFGAQAEPLRGRRLPCLIGDRSINLVSPATPVGSFLPHAMGAAWGMKLKGNNTRVLCFFGDGGTSRGEFHSAMNFAGIHRPPAIFICANNCWAVTTPLDCQTASTDFASKADAYNVRNLRIDGNDPLAAYVVTREAHQKAAEYGTTLIEAVTYRLGFHTSSDNPDLYRRKEEDEAWEKWDPIRRTRLYMEHKGWWSDDDESGMQSRYEEEIQAAVNAAEAMAVPGPEDQFEQLYAQPDWILQSQRERLNADLSEGAS
jgi:TPP-dependent pyruvate/acetoin dehydrogenase alpha subunit